MRPVSFIRTSPRTRGAEEGDGYEQPLSLDDAFVIHPSATFFVRVGAMVAPDEEHEIREGDILVVDRSLDPVPHRLMLVAEDGELHLCCWDTKEQRELEYWGTVVALARWI